MCAQLRTNCIVAEYYQLCSRTNFRPIKNRLNGCIIFIYNDVESPTTHAQRTANERDCGVRLLVAFTDLSSCCSRLLTDSAERSSTEKSLRR